MTAEVYDLKVDTHQSPFVLADSADPQSLAPQVLPPGDGWTGWKIEEKEDGTVIGHWMRRRLVKRGE